MFVYAHADAVSVCRVWFVDNLVVVVVMYSVRVVESVTIEMRAASWVGKNFGWACSY